MNAAGLDPRLAADTHFITALPLCDVRLMDDSRFPWLVLVPRRNGLVDWTGLTRGEQHQLADEIDAACRVLDRQHHPHKLNVATLGNVVRQMHVHVIARFRHDAAWPAPVWGVGTLVAHKAQARASAIARLALDFGRPGK